jgi:hypothetical protein
LLGTENALEVRLIVLMVILRLVASFGARMVWTM